MQAATFEQALEALLLKETRYPRDAYLFLREALDHTRKIREREAKAAASATPKRGGLIHQQHVSGQELLEGIRELALELYGPMAITVFEEWGITTSADFGEMVFILVENNLLRKTDKDTRADFENGYDFHEAFRNPFLPKDKIIKKQPKLPKGTGVLE